MTTDNVDLRLRDGRIQLRDVEQKGVEFKPLFARFDADMDLGFMKKFEFIGFDKRPVPKIINLTLNDPALFAVRCQGVLQMASPQLVAQSDTMKPDSLTRMEKFSEDYYTTVDEAVELSGLFGLYPFAVEQAVYRGRIGAFSLNRKENGKPKIDVRCIDTRYLIYEEDSDGFKYACNMTVHSRAYLKRKYNYEVPEGQLTEVCYDVFDREYNDFYIGSAKGDLSIPY